MTEHRVRGTRRVWVPALVLGLFAAILIGRLVQLQVLQHDDYSAQAKAELEGSTTLFARRGAILDRNGAVLAVSVDTWDIYVSARAWQDASVALPSSEELATLLATPAVDLREQVLRQEYGDVLVARDVAYEAGRTIVDAGISGVVALPNSQRVYPEGDVGASILGITGLDNDGLAGIEAALDDLLGGTPGRSIYERDTSGDPIPFGQFIAEEPVPGMDVVLTIDRYLQRMAEKALKDAIEEHDAKGGTIIVMDPATAEILAMATWPAMEYSTLDISDPAQLELLRNRAVTDLYEPGSVMKVITASAAIDAGLVTPNTTYVDTGIAKIYDTEIRNWQDSVYREQTMTGVLQHSINTGAIFMAELLGEDRFLQYLDAFGFDVPSGIELTGEAVGILRRPDDPAWSPVDLATQSFGQSISVTPIQMTTAVAAAINGGELLRPHLVREYVHPDGTTLRQEKIVRGRAVSEGTSALIRQMMAAVIDPGWYHPGKPDHYSAGGKSGTANVAIPNGAYAEKHVASFIGFAPVDDPEVLVLVKLDENADFETGTVAAGPVFAELVDESLAYLNVVPDAASFAREP